MDLGSIIISSSSRILRTTFSVPNLLKLSSHHLCSELVSGTRTNSLQVAVSLEGITTSLAEVCSTQHSRSNNNNLSRPEVCSELQQRSVSLTSVGICVRLTLRLSRSRSKRTGARFIWVNDPARVRWQYLWKQHEHRGCTGRKSLWTDAAASSTRPEQLWAFKAGRTHVQLGVSSSAE